MDKHNRFHTRVTYQLNRVDYLVVLAILIALAALHYREISWTRALIAFAWIDLVGYVPGALVYMRARGDRRRVARIFPILYNAAHSYGVNAAVLLAWYGLAGGLEWAMLAQPIHLCIDRGFFGNVYKPFGLPYEPVPHPMFQKFAVEFEESGRW